MAQDYKKVKARLKELHEDRLMFVSEEVWQLPSQLDEKEILCAIGSGHNDGKNRLLVVTDTRVLVLYQKKKELEAVSYAPEKIKELEIKKGIMTSNLTFFFNESATPMKFTDVNALHAIDIFNAVKKLLDSVPQISPDDTITRLERIAELRDKGVLTEEEFVTQKQSILSGTPPSPPVEEPPTPSPVETPPAPPAEPPHAEQETPAPKPAPSAAQEQEKKTSSTWVNVLVGILVIGGAYAFFSKDDKEAAPVEKAAEAPQTQSEATPQSPALVGHPLAVKIINYKEYERNGRNRLEITIIPAEDQSKATQADLAATAVAVATQAHKETEAPIVSVTMLCQKAANTYGEPQLAYVVYVADGLGMTGKTPGKIWEFLDAAPRGFTAQELQYLRLWAEMRGKYQSGGTTNEEKLEAAIAKKIGIKPGSLKPHMNLRSPLKCTLNIDGDLKIVQ